MSLADRSGPAVHIRELIVALVVGGVLAPQIASAQQIRGVVVHDSTDQPIAGATIELITQDSTVRATAVSSAIGWFQLSLPSHGRFLLRASHVVYGGGGAVEVVVGERELVNVVLRMTGGAIPLEPLSVTARSVDPLAGFRQRAAHGGQGYYLHREDIEKHAGARVSDLLRRMPGVRFDLVRDRSGFFTSETLLMRSLGELCEPTIYLDGVPMPPEFGMDINDLISTEALAGVEVYTSHLTAPLDLHIPRNSCGVIAFWSRPTPGTRMTWKRAAVAGMIAGLMLYFTRR